MTLTRYPGIKMMHIDQSLHFTKMTGTGNDFIIFDNRNGLFPKKPDQAALFALLCRRRFSVGADGVILLEKGTRAPLLMRYFNRDGYEAQMCGNGLRCLAFFAYYRGFEKNRLFQIEASDGCHDVEIHENIVAVSMADPVGISWNPGLLKAEGFEEGGFIDTGVPHYVLFTERLNDVDVEAVAPYYREHSIFKEGANVDFVEIKGDNHIAVRTFERGVEQETHSCGTGCVAAALAASKKHNLRQPVKTSTRGGDLIVSFDDQLHSIRLTAEVEIIYEGILNRDQIRFQIPF